VGLALFLLIHALVYTLIGLLDYMFVPAHEALQMGLALAIVIALTVDGVRCRKEQSSFSDIINAILPMVALFFVVTLLFHSSDSDLYIVFSTVTLLCSLILFFACPRSRIGKIILGVIYSIIVLLMLYAFSFVFLVVSMCPPGDVRVTQAELSPDGVYLAEVLEDGRSGSCGGAWIDVTRQGRRVNILIGVFQPAPQRVFSLPWWMVAQSIELRWGADSALYITYPADRGHRYVDTARFQRQGREWVRQGETVPCS